MIIMDANPIRAQTCEETSPTTVGMLNVDGLVLGIVMFHRRKNSKPWVFFSVPQSTSEMY